MRVVIVTVLALMIPALAVATELERETLAPDDGWAASGAGTTGGSLAMVDQIYTATNRAELIAALNNGVPSSTSPSNPSNVPKIIRVQGTIDFNVDDENQPLACEDYFRPDPTTGELFSYEAFEAAFDPSGPWGRVNPSGPQERARVASAAAQQARVRIRPGSNTTIVGLGKHAALKGIWMDIRGTANVADSRTNIIVRNLSFVDTYDCFPQWAPNDGALGSWNALYDSISLRDTNNVWVDHNRFADEETADVALPSRFGVLFQVHDGLLDITNASDLVTVSWNVFRDHDKVMLIGSSDNAPNDVGKLRVTLHHNLFAALGQRVPRVRFGQVHLYNNYYKICAAPGYGYSVGSGHPIADLRRGELLPRRYECDPAGSHHEPLQRHEHSRGRLAGAERGAASPPAPLRRPGRRVQRRQRSRSRADGGLGADALPEFAQRSRGPARGASARRNRRLLAVLPGLPLSTCEGLQPADEPWMFDDERRRCG